MKSQAEAQAAYQNVNADIRNLLEMIQDEVGAVREKINWGHVGSAKHVKHLLMEILMFETMTDPNAREDDFLAKLETQLVAMRSE